MQKKVNSFIIVGVISFVLGIFICMFVKKWTSLTINSQIGFEINPFEIFSLLTTIFLAIYVTRTLSKKNDLEKNEKDLLIRYLGEFKDQFNLKVSHILTNESFDTPETKSDLKILRKRVDAIIKLAKEHKFVNEDDKYANELTDKIREIWELLTECPEKITGRASPSIKNGMEKFRLEHIQKIEIGLIDTERIVFNFIMAINKK